MQVHVIWENSFISMSCLLLSYILFCPGLLFTAVEMVSHGPQCYSYCGIMGNLLCHLKNLLLICNATVFVYFKTVNKLISTCIHFLCDYLIFYLNFTVIFYGLISYTIVVVLTVWAFYR